MQLEVQANRLHHKTFFHPAYMRLIVSVPLLLAGIVATEPSYGYFVVIAAHGVGTALWDGQLPCDPFGVRPCRHHPRLLLPM
jgi:hypothetical protein